MLALQVKDSVYNGRSDAILSTHQERAKGILGYSTRQAVQLNTYDNTNDNKLQLLEEQKTAALVRAFSFDPLVSELSSSELQGLSDQQLETLATLFDNMTDKVDKFTDFETTKYKHNLEAINQERESRKDKK